MGRFLIIDPDEGLCTDISDFLGSIGHKTFHTHDFCGAVQLIEQAPFDVIISDLHPAGGTIRDLLQTVRERSAESIVLVSACIDTMQEGVQAVKDGAFGLIQRPFTIPELNFHIKKAIERRDLLRGPNSALPGKFRNVYQPLSFIGECPEIKDVFKIVNRVARTNSSVILTGETGTGKELIAGAIHYNSQRAQGPFVRVNCAALPEQLLESELFGYEKGAFTGADKLRLGRFEQADGGTIFLDEIADMSQFTQAKVLRVLQEKEFERLGGNETVKTDVRIISATNRDLRRLMEQGMFREDLYYRLNVVSIHLPPLRARRRDVELLARFFLRKLALALNKGVTGIAPEAMRILESYHWPGNIRELENCMERAVLLAEDELITPADLSLITGGALEPKNPRQIDLPEGGVHLEEVEKQLLLQALERTGWVQKSAARLLGISCRVMNYKVKRFGITHPRWKQHR